MANRKSAQVTHNATGGLADGNAGRKVYAVAKISIGDVCRSLARRHPRKSYRARDHARPETGREIRIARQAHYSKHPRIWERRVQIEVYELRPRIWRETFRKLVDMSDGQLRFIGLISMALGVVSLVALHYA